MVHHFTTCVAKSVGVVPAILLENIRYWVQKNKANGVNIFDGYCWTYNSISAFSEIFDYLTKRQIEYALAKLETSGYIKTGKYSDNPRDTTKWYTLTESGYALFRSGGRSGEDEPYNFVKRDSQFCETGTAKLGNGTNKIVKPDSQFCETYKVQIINTDVNTDVNTDSAPPAPQQRENGEAKKGRKAQNVVPLAFGDNPALQEAFGKWLAYKAEKGQGYKPIGLNQLITRVRAATAKYGTDSVVLLIEDSICNNWQGIAWERLERGGNGTNRQRHTDETGRYSYHNGDATGSF